MLVELYTKKDCSFCTRAKTFLTNRHIHWIEYLLDRDVTLDEIKEIFPLSKTFPIILVNDEVIGGYTDLVEKYSNDDFGQKLLQG